MHLFFQNISSLQINSSFINYSLQSFLPLKLDNEKYSYVGLYIIPEIVNNRIEGLYFTIIPLKEYNNEIITVNVLRDFTKDDYFTKRIKNTIPITDILTKDQLKVFSLLVRGYSSTRIASLLNKKPDNILKYNLRINDRLSNFFDIRFNTVREASSYYKNCFLIDKKQF